MNILILNPSANYPRLRAGNGVFWPENPLLHFVRERAGEWYIPFVNTKITWNVTVPRFRSEWMKRWTGWEKTRGDGMHSTRTSTALFMKP